LAQARAAPILKLWAVDGASLVGRLAAGVKLGAIVAFWLVAWIPLALYCLGAMALGALRKPGEAVR
jgi:hypothetical protein